MVRVNSVEDMKVDAVTGDFSLEDVLAEQKKDDWCITRSKELDGKSVLTNSPLARYTPATCEFDSGDILSAPFSLTQKGHLPLFVYKELVVTGYCSVVVSFH
mmetsp:Transcript_2612/g.4153  ORF Transcript_2612/g.4153 Transcript_2612/m.4153 type:complete len:102 (-) Transcript_2612:7-312(-)